ncbi:MerR family transcriptional regulator [Acidisoma sp. 7E03]
MSVLPLSRGPAPHEEDEASTPARLKKAPTAFRTISEVADDLHIPQHVLRFWETKFAQVRPLKRGGGRRYYRPDDVALLRRISHLLYTQGYTIKGVQRLLREGGGRLADDIPPPLQDDQEGDAENEAEALLHQEPDAPGRAEVIAPRLPLRFIPRSAAQPPLPANAGPSAAEQEAARLRRAMGDLLSGLEELRALLDR